MKKLALIAVVVLLMQPMVAVPSAFAAEESTQAESGFELTSEEHAMLDELSQKDLRIGYYVSLAYGVDSDGNETGVLVPFINLLRGWGLHIQPERLTDFNNYGVWGDGTADLYGLVSLLKTTSESLPSTKSFYDAEMLSISPKQSELNSLADIGGKRIGVLPEPAIEKAITMYLEGDETVITYQSVEEMLDAVQNHEIDLALTSLYVQADAAKHSSLTYKTLEGSVPFEKGIVGDNESMRPLINLINRYLDSPEGKTLEAQTHVALDNALIDQVKTSLNSEIAYLRERYDSITILGSEVLFPLCFREEGVFRGMVPEIAALFTEVTGIKVDLSVPEGDEGVSEMQEKIRSGEINAIASVYRSAAYNSDNSYSVPVYSDHVGLYTRYGSDFGDKRASELRVGVSVDLLPYIQWQPFFSASPRSYIDEKQLLNALDSGEIDLALVSQMAVDYNHTILKRYYYKRFDTSELNINMRTQYSPANPPELNRVMDDVISLYESSTAYMATDWGKLAVDYQQEYIKSESDLQRQTGLYTVALAGFSIILIASLILTVYQYRKYMRYDNRISDLFRAQDKMDIGFGDFKNKTMTCKGSWTLMRKIGLDPPYQQTLGFDQVNDLLGIDLYEKYRAAFDEMQATGEKIAVFEHDISHEGNSILLRQYVHFLAPQEFSFYVIDITKEKSERIALQQRADYDYLTHVFRRRAFIEAVEKKRKESSNPLYVALFDIDRFKRVNDSYGHEVGDKVLAMVAEKLDSLFAPGGIVGRWGGEEFSVVIESESLDQAAQCVATAIANIKAQQVSYGNGERKTVSITISAGLTAWQGGWELSDAMSCADIALYAAKHNGRNRYEVYHEGMQVNDDSQPSEG